MNKKLLWAIAVIIVIFGIIFFAGREKGGGGEDAGKPITIGFIGPLSGDAAAYGEPIKNGIELAVNEINNNGGVNGRQIVMIYEDGKCTGKDAASAAQKLANVDRVKYIVGGVCSGEAFGFAPITSTTKTMVIMPGASAPKLSGISPYIVRNNPNDNLAGVALANFLQKSYKKVAIISEQTDYSQGIKEVFVSQIQKNELEIVGDENYTTGTTDFRSVLLKIKNGKPEVFFINAQTPANIIRIAQQARQIGMTATIVGALLGTDPSVAAEKSLEAAIFADLPELAPEGKGQKFLSDYQSAYGSAPAFGFYAGAAYDAVHLFAQAITSVGDDTEKVQQYLHTLPSYEGTIGTYSFDQNGDIVGITPVFHKIENGKLVEVK